MISSATTRSREAVSRTLADQLEPVLRLHAYMRDAWPVQLDVPRARERVQSGRPAFDSVATLRSAGDMSSMFARMVSAFEVAGIASSADVLSVRRQHFDATEIAIGWAAGDRIPSDPAKRLARRAAAVLGNAVLQNAAGQLLAIQRVDHWARITCPCCGGAPDLALGRGSARRLVCSRCNTRWRPGGSGCLTCGADNEPTVVRIRAPYVGYTLLICNACGTYLKERTASGACEPLVDRELTSQLDRAAQDRGLRA